MSTQDSGAETTREGYVDFAMMDKEAEIARLRAERDRMVVAMDTLERLTQEERTDASAEAFGKAEGILYAIHCIRAALTPSESTSGETTT